MQTIVLDGIEYVLVPKEQLQPVAKVIQQPTPAELPRETHQDDFHGTLNDFTDEPVVDDGLATHNEKQEAIRVVEQPAPQQTVVTPQEIQVPKAQPRVHEYWRRFKNHELTPADVMTFSTMGKQFLEGNPEDPMIKADAKKPKDKRLFYGPGSEQEGA